MNDADTDSCRAAPAPSHESAFDLVVFGGSSGGLGAVSAILQGLPEDFAVPVIVMLHLPPDMGLPAFWRRERLAIEWASQGAVLQPGKILLCPPRAFAELLPDGSCMLTPCAGATERPIDRLFESVARSFGDRALGVVLTGMGDDGALGALELRRAGGYVLVQSAESAAQPSMPRAAIAAGAATMVLPLGELGHVVGELADGTPRSRLRAEREAIARTFGGLGDVAARARELDWSATGLGAVVGWPDELRVMTRMVVESVYPAAVWWGPDLLQVYNDRWRQLLGLHQHPQALGAPARQTWAGIWNDFGPMIEQVRQVGTSVGRQDYPMLVEREGLTESIYVTFSFAPIRDAGGTVAGVYNTVWETTRDVVADRRLKALRQLALRMAGSDQVRGACERAIAALAAAPQEAPFAMLYVVDAVRRQAVLAGAAGVEAGGPVAPHMVSLAEDDTAWPMVRAVAARAPDEEGGLRLDNLAQRFPGMLQLAATRAGAAPPSTALLLPLRTAGERVPVALLVLGLNPHLPFHETYRDFVDLMVEQIAAGIAQARLHEQERERAARSAELDRAKTLFFANVSHEFRTPLTLMLAPLDELLRRRDRLPGAIVDELDTAARNARRLLALVTNLLDFSQLEAGHRRARVAPHDLALLTADIASHFRSAIERAGLRLRLELESGLPPVPVDPEMWTKVVSNLLSNAFKFTFEGEISVVLKQLRLHAELVVSDTGVGIPEDELPHVFKRFHRVNGTRARTAEGAGIGLSMAHDLVYSMGGQLHVRSRVGKGTVFTIWLPFKSARQPGEAEDERAQAPAAAAAVIADEASRWLPGEADEPAGVQGGLPGHPDIPAPGTPRIVVADDNADMRDFLRRLLDPHWHVLPAADGETALELVRRHRPDVVLSDVMMPGMDGFALLGAIRGDASLANTPVILVTARAGEEATVEGLRAGADDYIVKPFSPRELVARVQAAVDRSRAAAAHTRKNA